MLYRSAQATDILLPRWHKQRAPEVILYRSAQATYSFLPRWHQQRAPEVMLNRSAQVFFYIFSSVDGGSKCALEVRTISLRPFERRLARLSTTVDHVGSRNSRRLRVRKQPRGANFGAAHLSAWAHFFEVIG